ncbi:MAG: hypothetical protein JXA61_01005 [Bacteroidales bacterium]|nr:hypothetical protein [Bacteroidales bacterium]
MRGILQLFIALGALGAGFLMMVNPDGSKIQMPLGMLEDSPFKDFLIPGIILFTVNGLGNLLAGCLSFLRHKLAGWAGIFLGCGLMNGSDIS